MKKQNLSLSLLIGAALTIPSLAMAAPVTTAQADVQTAAADSTMPVEAAPANSNMGADQSSPFAINETQRISRASTSSVNNNANEQAMPTELQNQQQDMQEPENMQNPEDMMIQEEGAQQDMMQEPDAQEDMMQEDSQEDMAN